MNPRFTILIQTCHRCKPWSQTQREGGCAGPCPCHFDGRDIIDHAKAGECPAGFYPALDSLPEGADTSVAETTAWGPLLWERLHTLANADDAWFMAWRQQIPCGPCANGFADIIEEMPPVYGDGWFAWTVAAHNAVNRTLGKPEMTVEEAWERWKSSN
jgi:hypothetical protein